MRGVTTDGSATPPAGWYRDPHGAGLDRYFDGAGWTADTRPAQLRRRAPRPQAAQSAPPAPDAPQPPATAAPSPTRPRRSLTDALSAGAQSAGVSAQSSQSLLLGTDAARPARIAHTAPVIPAGWYPDPARGTRLRYFDGAMWTARSREPASDAVRKLPKVALRLRARLLDVQDVAATRQIRKLRDRIVIPAEQVTPSLTLARRRQSGSVWGMLCTLVTILALIASGYLSWQVWGTDYYTAWRQQQLSKQLNAEAGKTDPWANVPTIIGTGTATNAGSVDTAPTSVPHVLINPNAGVDGSPVGRIRIPKIGLNMVFVLGTGPDQLALGPGLWKYGVMPGTPGNATISGHRTTHSHPFRHIDQLVLGDKIYIDVTGQPEAVYEVRGTTIASPFDVKVTQQTAGARLTMTTCNPVGSASQRMVVESELISGTYAYAALPRSAWKLLS